MRVPEIVTVSAARSGLSRILAELTEAGASAEPVLIGAHRKAQGVLLSVETYERLVSGRDRQTAADSATASLAAEGLRASAASDHDTAEYVQGRISADQLVDRALARHRPASQDRLAG